jgi:hypothetical protein
MKISKTSTIQWNKYQLEDIAISQSVRDMLIKKSNKMYICYNDLKNLMVEAGGSPFSYCFSYSNERTFDLWNFNIDELMYYMNLDNKDAFNWEDGWDYMNKEGWFNWKDIGYRLTQIADMEFDIENKLNLYDKTLIPIEWVLSKLDNVTNNDFNIIFSTEDWYHTIYNQQFAEC